LNTFLYFFISPSVAILFATFFFPHFVSAHKQYSFLR
jgi:hypothetical protein